MIKSCADCKTKCCRSGPGPYKKVSAHDWLHVLQGSEKYNSMCENYDEDTGFCKEWNTGNVPIVCKTYVCGIREYSKEELEQIDYYLKIIAKSKAKL